MGGVGGVLKVEVKYTHNPSAFSLQGLNFWLMHAQQEKKVRAQHICGIWIKSWKVHLSLRKMGRSR